jgi:hypothetical protein
MDINPLLAKSELFASVQSFTICIPMITSKRNYGNIGLTLGIPSGLVAKSTILKLDKIINKRMETRKKMFEAAKKFIGKKCVIYTFNSDYITGVVKEVTDGAVIVDRKGKEEIVNLDFIVRIKDASDNK